MREWFEFVNGSFYIDIKNGIKFIMLIFNNLK